MMRSPPGGAAGGDYNSDSSAALGSLTITIVEGNELVERRKVKKPATTSSVTGSFFGTSSATTSGSSGSSGSSSGGGGVGGGSGGSSSAGDYLWPYVVIHVGHSARRSSSTVLNTSSSSCTWGEEFLFEGIRATQSIQITCYAGRGAAEAPVLEERAAVVGDVTIPVIRLPEGHTVEQWYQLSPRVEAPGKICKAAVKLRLFFQTKQDLFSTTLDGATAEEMLALGSTQSLDPLDASLLSSPIMPPDTPPSTSGHHNHSLSSTTNAIAIASSSGGDGHHPSMTTTQRPHGLAATSRAQQLAKTSGLSSSPIMEMPATPLGANMPPSSSNSNTAPTPSNLNELAQAELPTGVVDYFTIFGARLNDTTGLPSKTADLLMRFPLQDRPEAPLVPKGEEMAHPFFCFPDGVELHYGPQPPPLEPQTRTFIMRGESFGVCIYFHRRWSRLSEDAMSPSSGFSLRRTLAETNTTTTDDQQQRGAQTTPSSSTASGGDSHSSSSSSDSRKEGGGGPSTTTAGGGGEGPVWAPVCICLMTRLGLLRPLQQWLVSIYDRIDALFPPDYDPLVHEDPDTAMHSLSALLRSHIVQVTLEVPQPQPGALGVQFEDVVGRALTLRYPGAGALPPLSHPLSTLLHAFAPRNVLTLVAALMCEWSVVLHSSDLSILPVIALSVTALIYPLKWHLAYLVPLPHAFLSVMLESPHAYLIGIHTSWLPEIDKLLAEKMRLGEEDFLREALLVDCDSGTITKLSNHHVKPPSLPPSIHEHLYRKIRSTVHPALEQMDSAQVILDRETFDTTATPIRASQENELRVMFARCVAYLLSGYQDCIFFLDSATPCFIHERFLAEYCLDEDNKFMSRVVETQGFMSFLQYYESPHCEYFRSLLQRAYSRATSRPASPPPMMSSHAAMGNTGGADNKGGNHPPTVPKKFLADFQVVDDGLDWLGEPSTEGGGLMSASNSNSSSGGGSMADIAVKLTLPIPPPPASSSAAAAAAKKEASAVSGEGGKAAGPPSRAFSFSDGDPGDDQSSSSSSGAGPAPPAKAAPGTSSTDQPQPPAFVVARRGSAPPAMGTSTTTSPPSSAATDEEEDTSSSSSSSGGQQQKQQQGLMKGPSVRFNVPGPSPPTTTRSDSTGSAAAEEEGAEQQQASALSSPERGYRKRGQAPQPLGMSLLPSPTRPERGGGRSSSLGEYELDAMMSRLRTTGTLAPEPPPSTRGAGKEEVEEEEEWREARRWTVEEAAEMMGVTVRDVARALGLNFDLQRVMTRGHTVLGFMEAPPTLDMLGEGAGGMGSLMGGAVGGAVSHEATHINNCLRYAFSSDKLPQRDLDLAEQYFRLKDVRQRFVAILNQPRSKRISYNSRAGPAGQFRVHTQGFETLMQLASAVLNACLSEKDNVSAHTLLQVMGRYYQVQEQSSEPSAWSYLRSDAQHKEFLSSRLRHHKIYQNVDLWVNVLKEQLAEEAAAKKKPPPPQAGPAPRTSDKAEPQDPKKLAQRVKLMLMEMHGVGMPDQKAVAFVGRVCETYKPGPEIKQSLVKLSQKIWKTDAPKDGEESGGRSSGGGPRGAAASVGVSGVDADANSEAIPGKDGQQLLKRRVSFSSQVAGGEGVPGGSGTGVAGPFGPTGLGSGGSSNKRQGSAFTFSDKGGGGGGGGGGGLGSVGGSGMQQMMGGSADSSGGGSSTHKGPVLSLDVDEDGSLGVSGGADKLLVVYSIQQKARVATFTGHSGPVTCTRIFKDKDGEAVLASASMDSTLRLWKLTGSSMGGDGGGGGLGGGAGLLARFTTSKDVRSVLTGHRDGGIISMDVKTDDEQMIVTGGVDRTIKLWSVSQCRNTSTLAGHTGPVSCVRFLEPLGAARAMGSHGPTPMGQAPYRILSASHDKTMIQWDPVHGTCLRIYRGHEGWVRCLQCWGKGDMAVTASNDRTLRVWDLRVDNSVQKLAEHRGAVTCLQVADGSDAPLLFSGSTDGTVKVWDLRSGGRCTASLGGHTEAVTCLGLQQTGGVSKIISAGEDRRLVEYDVRSGVVLQSRLGHRDGISALRVCGQKTIITGSWDHTVRLWPSSNSSPAPG